MIGQRKKLRVESTTHLQCARLVCDQGEPGASQLVVELSRVQENAMDHDQIGRGWSGDESKRDHQLRRELDEAIEATPSTGLFRLILGALLIVALAVFLSAHSVGDNPSIASRDKIETPASSATPGNQ
jgi:hypothetical protein